MQNQFKYLEGSKNIYSQLTPNKFILLQLKRLFGSFQMFSDKPHHFCDIHSKSYFAQFLLFTDNSDPMLLEPNIEIRYGPSLSGKYNITTEIFVRAVNFGYLYRICNF